MSSIALYGPPGSGKTTCASTLTKLGFRVHYLDWDQKIQGLDNLQPLLKSGKITYQQPEEDNRDSLKTIALESMRYFPKRPPKGFVELFEAVDQLRDDPPEDHHNMVPVIDSLTRVNEQMQLYLMYVSKKPKLDFDGWAAVALNWKELFNTFFKLQPDIYPHCIIILHSMDDKDETLQQIWTKPLIDGQTKNKVGTWVEEMFFCQVEVHGKRSEPKYTMITKPTGRITQARSSRIQEVVVEADLSLYFDGPNQPSG